ncbi:glycosyltransferase family 4 protein [Candidatus Sumerlaeota bacterium]|nr:glycosyltransferase family 4 protein [Candidatus Sumerlaeota bacterium]
MNDKMTRPTTISVMQLSAVDFTIRQFLLPLMHSLRDAGYDVSFACSPSDDCAKIEAQGFRYVPNYISRAFRLGKHLKSFVATYRMLRREHVQILHVHTPIAALLSRPMAKLAHIPVVFYTVHGFYFHENMPWYKRLPHIMIEWFGARFTDYIFMVSAEDKETATRLGIMRPEKMLTIRNGVDMNHYDPARFSADDRRLLRERLGIAPAVPVIGIVGRLVREKGYYEFFHAAAAIREKYPEARFLIVGDVLPSDYDAQKQAMIDCTKEIGIDASLCWAGLVPDTAPYLSIMDVFCLPSYREGMPVSMLEAMAMELPQVATNIRGCREEVVDGETGYLIPVHDKDALASAVMRLLDDKDRAVAMGSASRQRVREMFDLEKILQMQLDVYQRFSEKLQ